MTKISEHKLTQMLLMKGHSDRTRFSVYSAILSLVITFYWYNVPVMLFAKNINFFYSIPLATFLCAHLGWKLVITSKGSYTLGNIVALSLILTVTTSLLNWIILAIERRITGDNYDLEGILESPLTTFVYDPLLNTYASLFMVGYVGVILFVTSGLFVIKTRQLK